MTDESFSTSSPEENIEDKSFYREVMDDTNLFCTVAGFLLKRQWEEAANSTDFPFFNDELLQERIANLSGTERKTERLYLFKTYLDIYDQFCINQHIKDEERLYYIDVYDFFTNERKPGLHITDPTTSQFFTKYFNMPLNDRYDELKTENKPDILRVLYSAGYEVPRFIRDNPSKRTFYIYLIVLFDEDLIRVNANMEMKEEDFLNKNFYQNITEFEMAFGEYCDEYGKRYVIDKNRTADRYKTFQCTSCNAVIKLSIHTNGEVKIKTNKKHEEGCKGGEPKLPKVFLTNKAEILNRCGELSIYTLQQSIHSKQSNYILEKTIRNVQNENSNSFSKLSSLFENIEKAEGSTILTEDERVLKAAGFVTKMAVNFLSSSSFSKLLFIDGQFSMATVKGVYVTVSTNTPTGQLFLISCSWGYSESQIVVEQALKPILNSMPEFASIELIVIADEGKGIEAAIRNILPKAQLKNCAWHVSLKLSRYPELLKLFWAFVKSDSKKEKLRIKNDIIAKFPKEYATILEPRLENIVSLVDDATYGYVSSSLAESSNAMMKRVKHDDPVIYFTNFISKQYSLLIDYRFQLSQEPEGRITNIALQKLNFSKRKAQELITKTKDPNSVLQIVYDPRCEEEYMVNRFTKTCTCGRSIRGIACSHLIRFLEPNSDFDFVAPFYFKEPFKQFIEASLELPIPVLTNLDSDDLHAEGRNDRRLSKKRKLSQGFR